MFDDGAAARNAAAMGTTPQQRSTRFTNVRWRGGQLYYRFVDEHSRRREVRYGAGNPADAARAQRIAQEHADRIRAGLVSRTEADGEHNARRPLSEMVAAYCKWLEGEQVSDAHKYDVRLRVTAWSDWCDCPTVGELGVEDITRYLRGRGWSATTQQNVRRRIVAFLMWCEKHRHVRLPITAAMIPVPKAQPADRRTSQTCRDMTAQEFGVLIEGLRGRTPDYRRAAYLLAAFAGLRWAELWRVEWADIDLEHGLLEVRGKTRDEQVPLIGVVCDALAELPRSGPLAFPHRITRRTWLADLARSGLVRLRDPKLPQAQRYNLDNLIGYRDARGRVLGPYSLRKACATWLIESGADVKTVMETMRHADARTTLKLYAGLRMSRQMSAMEQAAAPVLPPKSVRSCPLVSADGRNRRNAGA